MTDSESHLFGQKTFTLCKQTSHEGHCDHEQERVWKRAVTAGRCGHLIIEFSSWEDEAMLTNRFYGRLKGLSIT